MAGIMDFARRLVRRRKHERYHVMKGAFLIIKPSTDEEKKIQILDISEGGLAFVYTGSKEELKDSGILKLLSGDTPCLEKVNYEIVADQVISEDPDINAQHRRKGVQFKWLGVLDEARLKDFIKKNSVCPVS